MESKNAILLENTKVSGSAYIKEVSEQQQIVLVPLLIENDSEINLINQEIKTPTEEHTEMSL